MTTIATNGQGRQTQPTGGTVTAVAYPPSGRRRFPTLVVPRCPYCGGAHLHRGAPGQRAAGCNPRRTYTVAVKR